jgi:5-methylcytosine-specific restriction endonuclease McrA
MTSTIQSFAHLSDDELLATVKRLATRERQATAALVRSLMELDSRRLYLGEGYSSLFTYCTQALHLAEGAAYNRIEAARAARRFPAILAAFDEGAVTLTAVRLLAPHLTPANHRGVLARARHKAKREDLERRRCAAITFPRAASMTVGGSRHIPAAVKRDVWRRDEGRCAYVGREGRCTERGFLEYHHLRPYAAGGVATTANIELRCRAHNAYEAALFFGRECDDVVEQPNM